MRPVHKRVAAAGLVGIVALALTGCGVPVDRGPTVLSKAAVPFDLLGPSSPPTTAPSLLSPRAAAVRIFLLDPSGHLVAVEREVAASQDTLVSILGVLVQGPTQTETAAGLQSAIPPQTTIISASVDPSGLATVDVGGTFGQLVGRAQVEAIAQMVFTASSLATTGVTTVTFQLGGQPVEVPVDSGAQIPVVNTSQFPSLAPLPPPQHTIAPSIP